MNTLSLPPLVIVSAFLAIAVAGLLCAEIKSSRAGAALTKTVASTTFIVAGLLAGALSSVYGQLILLGLVLSWLGDVFLIPKRPIYFILGLGSFLLAHVAFGFAFIQLPMAAASLAITAIMASILAYIVLQWLWPHLPTKLRHAVVAYLGAISVMVVLAGGTVTTVGPQLFAGAIVFAVSDVFVARERFVSSSLVNRLWGLPLYYAAQLVFALSIQSH